MDEASSNDSKEILVARLAHKTGFSESDARTFLDALTELKTEDEQWMPLVTAPLLTHLASLRRSRRSFVSSPVQAIHLPLVERDDGTMTLDMSQAGSLHILDPQHLDPPHPDVADPGNPQTAPGQPAVAPGTPARPPDKPRRPPGAYPGPSVQVYQSTGGAYPGPSVYAASVAGGYPGPSIVITLHDPQKGNLEIRNLELGGLGDALAQAKPASGLEEMRWSGDIAGEPLKER